MLLNLQHYHRPGTIPEAIALLKKNPDAVAPLAGGTYFVASGARHITEVVDITHLGLSSISRDENVVRIGSTTTLQEIIDSEVTKGLAQAVLVEACRTTTVSRMRRNVSTIGGEIVAAAAASGVPVALLALDARLKIVDKQEREVTLADFYLADVQSPLRGAIITEVSIPIPGPGARAAFLRLAQITSSIPIIQMATFIEFEDDLCREARLAIGAATTRPMRVPSAEALLVGRTLDDPTIRRAADELTASINPIHDTRGTAQYRRQMSRVLTRRTLSLVVSRP
jgi:carbon-monoxide dehydrogenase medium subunit